MAKSDSRAARSGKTDVTKFRRSEGVVARDMGNTAVLIHLESNRIYELNVTGARVWSMLEQALGRDEICARLEQEFTGTTSEVGPAVDELLTELEREHLICG